MLGSRSGDLTGTGRRGPRHHSFSGAHTCAPPTGWSPVPLSETRSPPHPLLPGPDAERSTSSAPQHWAVPQAGADWPRGGGAPGPCGQTRQSPGTEGQRCSRPQRGLASSGSLFLPLSSPHQPSAEPRGAPDTGKQEPSLGRATTDRSSSTGRQPPRGQGSWRHRRGRGFRFQASPTPHVV